MILITPQNEMNIVRICCIASDIAYTHPGIHGNDCQR